VTPTSYLALLGTFKSLLKDKKNEIINMKSRYEMGLGKLEFASNQVNNEVLLNYALGIILIEGTLRLGIVLSQPRVKGCLEMPGFEVPSLWFPA